jgi:hypothetical protein
MFETYQKRSAFYEVDGATFKGVTLIRESPNLGTQEVIFCASNR